MVKFGGHVEALREGDLADSELYLIPYNNMKLKIHEHKENEDENAAMLIQENSGMLNQKLINGVDFVFDGAERKQAEDEQLSEEEFFSAIWKKGLKDAEEDFHKVRGEIWETIFAGIAANDDATDPLVRGAHPGNAIKLYVELSHTKGGTDAQDLLARMKQIYQAASTNSEALRKLVKKSDKYRGEKQLSSKLLPLLYTSSLYSGQNMIQDSIDLLRDLISGDFDYSDSDPDDDNDLFDRQFKKLVRHDSETRHQESVDIRMMEFNWLKSLVQSIPSKELLPKLVAHRGFHNIKDRNDKRPVENSLSAYEMAWSCGIELCECDIALTKDEKLVLAHDENFARLSLDAESANSKRKVGDLTLKEIISMPLTNGVRPPLLIDVLRSASAISERSKLIIEIKPGNEASAFALARLLIRHSDLRSSVAMIMSFDAATMHRLREELDRAIVPDSRDYTGGDTGMPLHSHRRVTSYDHFGTTSSGWLAGMGEGGGHSSPKLTGIARSNASMNVSPIGLSISQLNLNQTPSTNSLKAEETLEDVTGLALSQPFASHSRESHNMPKLMLLTVADPPAIACELQVHYNELHRVDNWLIHDEGVLDGVYLQYEKEMMTPEGAAYLRQLSKRTMVGIWNYAERDPDNFETFEWLVKEGNCSFVNTDLPRYFCKGVLTQKGRPPLP
jgi:glycerophosphoryl diester phosphodiesterase